MTDPTEMKVLIIGAGSCGLLIAQGLKKAGIPFEIFEKHESTLNSRDWSMALHWGAGWINSCLSDDLISKLESIECDPYYRVEHENVPDVRFCNGATGETLAAIPAKVMWRVSRKKTRNFFSQGIDIQYKKNLVSLSRTPKSVIVTFDDSTTSTGTHIVGADGAKSYVRNFLLGPEISALSSLPIAMLNFKTSFTAEQAHYLKETKGHHPITNFGIHPDQDAMYMLSILDVPDRNDAATWIFQLYFSSMTVDNDAVRAMDSEQRRQLLKDRAQYFAEPWKSAFQWVQEGTVIPCDLVTYWKDPVQWDNYGGRVTLAGDAAHTIPPYRGQGFNNAIQDAVNYVEAMKKVRDGGDMEEIISAYDADVLDRGRKEIGVSLAQADSSHKVREFMKSPLAKIGIKKGVDMESLK